MLVSAFPPLTIETDLELWGALIEFGLYGVFFGGPILLGFVFGRINESKHHESLQKREKELLYLPCVTSKLEHVTTPEQRAHIQSAYMVSGSVVLSDDFFKKTIAGLRCMFGGNIASYESIVDRARREALLRMKEQARHMDMIVNTRIETSTISMSSKAKDDDVPTTIEVLAFGTAIAIGKDGHDVAPISKAAITHQTAQDEFNTTIQHDASALDVTPNPEPSRHTSTFHTQVQHTNQASSPEHLQSPPMPAPLPETPQVSPVDLSNITLPSHNSLFNR